ncbi:hypothetical protein C8J57DRAFT_1233148 [Mycena rebaudengoi]|nr:hypothetical protein C8J57DRAFT_1233148 [Mycena rebaudengoi]
MFISRLLVIFSAVAVGISIPTERTVGDITGDLSTLNFGSGSRTGVEYLDGRVFGHSDYVQCPCHHLPSAFKATGALSATISTIIYKSVEALIDLITDFLKRLSDAASSLKALGLQVVAPILGDLITLQTGCSAYFIGLSLICLSKATDIIAVTVEINGKFNTAISTIEAP